MSQTPPPLPGDLPPAPPPLPGSTPPTVPGALGQSSGGWVTPYSFSNAFNKGLELFRTMWGQLVLMTLALIGIAIVGAVVQNVAVALGGGWAGLIISYAVSFTLGVLLTTPLMAGAAVAVAQRLRGRTGAGVSDMFALVFGPRYGAIVLASLLFTLAAYVGGLIIASPLIATGIINSSMLTPGLPGGPPPAPAGNTPGVLIGASFVLLIVGAIALYYVLVRLFPALSIVLDPRVKPLTATDAFRASWHLTQGKGWSMLGLALASSILSALTVLLLCVGIVLVGYPLMLAIFGAAYAMIVHPMIQRDVCTTCGFDLSGNTTGTCPECGTFNAQATGAQGLSRTA